MAKLQYQHGDETKLPLKNYLAYYGKDTFTLPSSSSLVSSSSEFISINSNELFKHHLTTSDLAISKNSNIKKLIRVVGAALISKVKKRLILHTHYRYSCNKLFSTWTKRSALYIRIYYVSWGFQPLDPNWKKLISINCTGKERKEKNVDDD